MWKEPEYYDREKLYEEVWAEPVSKVAAHYEISGVALGKICRKMRIPVPGRGYWAKLQNGHKVKKTPLPSYAKCPKVQKVYRKKPTPEVVKEKPIERLVPEAFVLEEQLIQQESLPDMNIEYDPDIKLSNQYVKQTSRNLKDSKKHISKTYGYGRCNSSDDEAFEVTVGPDNITRALAILQTLCTELKKRGYSVGPKPKSPKPNPHYQQYGYTQKETSPIYLIMLDAYISIKITETSKKQQLSEKVKRKRITIMSMFHRGNSRLKS